MSFEQSRPSSSATGTRRNAECVVGDDTYAPDAPTQTTIFIPILPPPAVPCASPTSTSPSASLIDFDALCDALETSAPRPAPLAWKSPHDTLASSGGSSHGLRQKRPAPSYFEEAPSHLPTKKRVSPPADESLLGVEDVDPRGYAFEPAPDVPSAPPVKRARRSSLCPRPQVRLSRHVPVHVSPAPPAAALAVFSASSSRLVTLGEYKATPRAAPPSGERSPSMPRYPVSCARDEPLVPRVGSPAPPKSNGRAHESQPSGRRDSLVSTASTGGLSALFFCNSTGRGRRGSLETSISSASAAFSGGDERA
ncbi:hypothetical protein JCM3770_003373 [Rhodotorula araucariae]